MSDPGQSQPLQPRPKRPNNRHSPEQMTPKKLRIEAEIHREFDVPVAPVAATLQPRLSAAPGTPREDAITVDIKPDESPSRQGELLIRESPLPSPASLQRSATLRLAISHSRDRKQWTWPAFRDDEDTVLLADSNGIELAKHKPLSWRVVAYRGRLLEDANKILADRPLPPTIKHIFIFFGVNNLDRRFPALINHMANKTSNDSANYRVTSQLYQFVNYYIV